MIIFLKFKLSTTEPLQDLGLLWVQPQFGLCNQTGPNWVNTTLAQSSRDLITQSFCDKVVIFFKLPFAIVDVGNLNDVDAMKDFSPQSQTFNPMSDIRAADKGTI